MEKTLNGKNVDWDKMLKSEKRRLEIMSTMKKHQHGQNAD